MKNRIWIIGIVAAAFVVAAWAYWGRVDPVQAQLSQKKGEAVWASMIGKKCDVNLIKGAQNVRFTDCILLAADDYWIRVQRMQRYIHVFPRENIVSVAFQPTVGL